MSNTYTCTFVLASPQHRWTHQCSATFLIFTSIIIIYSYSYHCYITLHSLFKMLAALLTVCWLGREKLILHIELDLVGGLVEDLLLFLWKWAAAVAGGTLCLLICCYFFSNCLSFIKIPEKWIHTEFIKNIFLIRVMSKMIF